MTTIYNSDLIKELIEIAKLHPAKDFIPSTLAKVVVPVVDVNPKHSRYCNIAETLTSITTGAFTLYTTPSDRDFFVTSCSLAIMKDATCDTATGAITLFSTDDSAGNAGLLGISTITLTAQSEAISVAFPTPVKVGRARAIQVSGAFTVGVLVRVASVQGYFLESKERTAISGS